ncbi:metallothionein [Poseidonibacter lekithochrous]|uniref:PP0621 family protein n=1 Tax=Poseidonibacter TaxID=2321187 RepID=UPI001C0A5CED|nr:MULTISPECIES: PP0621 family protein [Poseidonibacter]MBU3014870.1 metallothionein [Poseidonibacter lekithochrous]MDO6828168.1 PP0621 family protein [Poseidonibacter sp. 1_MG-2023]
MILKILAFALVLFIVYIIFFKKNREKTIVKKKDIKYEDEMLECPTCKTYISTKESILSNGKYYCSEECLKNK